MDKKIHWHAAFCAAMELEFLADCDALDYMKEYPFSQEPLKADLLIIKKEPEAILKNEIGELFRTWNILEYKSPGDAMTIDDFYKVCAYACLWKALSPVKDMYPAEDISVSLVRRSYPRELIRSLEKTGYVVCKIHDGIYQVEGNLMFRTQIIVSGQLEKERHTWLRSLTRKIDGTDFLHLTSDIRGMQGKHERECADAVMEVVASANQEVIRTWRDAGMWEALREIMEPELTKAKEDGIGRGELRKLVDLLCRKLVKGKTPAAIAEDLEEEPEKILQIYQVAAKYAPEYNVDSIVQELLSEDKPVAV